MNDTVNGVVPSAKGESSMTLSDKLVDIARPADLGDGRQVRLRTAPDDINWLDETDSYGKVVSFHAKGAWDYDYGRTVRPDGFDGNAEKLYVGGDGFWWQPPGDVPRTDVENFDLVRKVVRDLIEYGTSIWIVEVTEGVDAYGRPIVREVASLGGVEPFPTVDYQRSIVSDLLAELGIEGGSA